MFVRFLFCMALIVVVSLPSTLRSQAPVAKPSPEDVAREFLVALLTRDKATIERLVLPSPEAEILLKDPPLGIKQRAQGRELAEGAKLRQLKVGDVIDLPDGQKYTVAKELVTDDRVLILPEGFRLPLVIERDHDKSWKVNVESLIAERKKIAEKKAEAEKEKAKK